MTRLQCKRAGVALLTAIAVAHWAGAAERMRGETFEFVTPRIELRQTVKTVGVMPVIVPADLPDADGVSSRYEAAIVARLADAGFDVVPPEAMRAIRERLKITMGGVYDPMTGAAIKSKVDTLEQFSTSEYRASHKVDATLQPEIFERMISFSYGSVRWDGVTESVTGQSAWTDLWKESADLLGQIPVLSFIVRMRDSSGKVLYGGIGGLQVLGYWRNWAKWNSWSRNDQLRGIDTKFLMTDPARDARALSLALDPLLKGSVSKLPDVERLPVAAPEAHSALRVARETLLAQYPRLLLAPLAIDAIQAGEEVRQRYHDALAQKLTALGFQVVSGDEYGRLWDTERAAAGGYFNPRTGQLDAAKLKASRQRVFESMKVHGTITALVLPRVIDTAARFSGTSANWDGVKQSLANKNKLFGQFSSDPPYGYTGYVKARSLEVLILDPGGELLFAGYGGIQVTEQFVGKNRRDLADTELFSDPSLDTGAVGVALAELAPPAAALLH